MPVGAAAVTAVTPVAAPAPPAPLVLVEHKLAVVLEQELRRAAQVGEEAVHAPDVVDVDAWHAPRLGDERSAHALLHGVAQRRVAGDAREQVRCLGAHLDVLLLAADREDGAQLLLAVGPRRKEEENDAVEQVDGMPRGAPKPVQQAPLRRGGLPREARLRRPFLGPEP